MVRRDRAQVRPLVLVPRPALWAGVAGRSRARNGGSDALHFTRQGIKAVQSSWAAFTHRARSGVQNTGELGFYQLTRGPVVRPKDGMSWGVSRYCSVRDLLSPTSQCPLPFSYSTERRRGPVPSQPSVRLPTAFSPAFVSARGPLAAINGGRATPSPLSPRRRLSRLRGNEPVTPESPAVPLALRGPPQHRRDAPSTILGGWHCRDFDRRRYLGPNRRPPWQPQEPMVTVALSIPPKFEGAGLMTTPEAALKMRTTSGPRAAVVFPQIQAARITHKGTQKVLQGICPLLLSRLLSPGAICVPPTEGCRADELSRLPRIRPELQTRSSSILRQPPKP